MDASVGSFDLESARAAEAAIARLRNRLLQVAPSAVSHLDAWITALSGTDVPTDYFKGGRAILLLLPRFLSRACCRIADTAFELDLEYSTVTAYYSVRLIDDVMDRAATARPDLLPLVGFLHAEFQSTYMRHFQPGSAFWDHFGRIWGTVTESTIEDARRTDLSFDDFVLLSTGKSGGVKIALAAVCEHYGRPDLLKAWCDFFDAFAVWSQMVDDLFDWVRDCAQGSVTYFLAEAKRRKSWNESLSEWILTEGMKWGYLTAVDQGNAVLDIATRLGSEELRGYLDDWQAHIESNWNTLGPSLPQLARLAAALEK